MSCRKFFPSVLLTFSSLLIFNISVFAQDGEALFKANCTSCHSIGKGTVIGPDLKDIEKRRPSEWIHSWIKSSTTMIKAGDAYGIELFNKFNKTSMPDQSLSDAEIVVVMEYIAKKSSEPAPVATTTAAAGTEGGAEATDNTTTWIFVALLLITLFYILSSIMKRLEQAARAKKGIPEPAKLPWRKWARENKKLIALGLIVFMVGGSVKGWYVLADIGIAEGYQPDQPIEFSHKIHAGDMNINCVYCHSGAEKSKTAGVPSANVCMNCHKFIKEGKTTGTKEIAKIYAALDYNPETQSYGKNSKPIEWVRVHNLPDHVYFNHSQHVSVAGVECQKCHGEMEKQGVANQFAPLTMGWCIDCHIETPVKTEGNKYYDDFKVLHFNKYKHHEDGEAFSVERMGGTECAKCHY